MHRSHLPKLRAPHTYLSWTAWRPLGRTGRWVWLPRPLLSERALARRVSVLLATSRPGRQDRRQR